MLSIEQEPIRLPSVVSEVDGPDGRFVRLSGHGPILVPRRFLFLWDQTKIGASIYDLSLRQRARGDGSRVFLHVANFLCFLVDHDLIDDLRVVQLADSIRGEYEWPEDLLSDVSYSGSITIWGRRVQKKVPLVSRSYDFISSIFTLVSLPFFVALTVLLFDASEVSTVPYGWLMLAGFFVGGVLGRTGAAALRAVGGLIGGDAGEVSWKVDVCGPYLAYEAHTVTGAIRRASDFTMCFATVTVPLVGILFASLWTRASHPQWPASIWAILALGSLFHAALSTHPAAKSNLTRSLRVWNRTPMVWREEDELREVEFFHRIGGFASASVAAIFFGLFAVAVIKVRPDLSMLRSDFANVMGVAVILFGTAVTYIEPFFRHELPGVSKRNKRRRLWATRNKILKVTAGDREAWNQLPVLRQLTAPLRRQLMNAARVIQVRRGVAICRQGGTDRSLYIVLDGQFGVAKSFEGRRRKVVAILNAGAVFGETAFFFGNPRTADVVAIEDSRVLEIPYLTMMKDLDISSSEEFQFRVWLLQALSGNTMLQELPSEAMDTLIFSGVRKTFRAGEAIFTEGAPAETCYFIAQGRASAIQGGRKIGEMGAGDAFGEIALLKTGGMRTASVVADSDLLCMELDVNLFWSLLASRLPLGTEIERLALRRLRADEDRRQKN